MWDGRQFGEDIHGKSCIQLVEAIAPSQCQGQCACVGGQLKLMLFRAFMLSFGRFIV